MASQTQAQLTKFMACPQKKGKKNVRASWEPAGTVCTPPSCVSPTPAHHHILIWGANLSTQLVTRGCTWWAPTPGLNPVGNRMPKPPAILRGCCGKPGLCLCWLFNILLQPLISFTTSSAAPNACNQGTERKSRPGPALPGKGHLHRGCWHQLPNRHHKEGPGHNPPMPCVHLYRRPIIFLSPFCSGGHSSTGQ